MADVVAGLAVFGAVIAVGWLLVRTRAVPADADGVLTRVCFFAATPALVADVQTRSHGADDYTVFLRDSQDCLARLITAIEDDDVARIMRQIARNRALLAGLSRIGGRTIETTKLSRLVEIALDHGATAKSSGAGGGDCGIALCPPATDLVALRAAWETAGIRPLDLSVYSQDSSAACAADPTEAHADSSTASPVKVTP